MIILILAIIVIVVFIIILLLARKDIIITSIILSTSLCSFRSPASGMSISLAGSGSVVQKQLYFVSYEGSWLCLQSMFPAEAHKTVTTPLLAPGDADRVRHLGGERPSVYSAPPFRGTVWIVQGFRRVAQFRWVANKFERVFTCL